MNKLIILSRDGVINEDIGETIADPDQWLPIPGSLEAIARLSQAGYRVAAATNQPGLAQGVLGLDALNAIHHRLHDQLDRMGGHLVAIAYCPHGPNEGCSCRKPRAGLHRQLMERLGVGPQNTVVVGDRPSDMAAAAEIGARGVLVRTGRDGALPEDCPVELFDNLAHVASALLVED